MSLNTKIIGIGSHLPANIMKNEDFKGYTFYKKTGVRIDKPTEQIVKKLEDISEIKERRYATKGTDNASMAAAAAEAAIQDSGIDRETIDQIIFAHNFGNVPKTGFNNDLLPNLSARVKHKLGIKNEMCVAYDILFGCPGWVQGIIQGHLYIKAGAAKRILVIGADLMSRMVDNNDLDSMLFSDGAGACVIEAEESEEASGVLAFKTVSSCKTDLNYITSAQSILSKDEDDPIYYIRMNGRGVYKYGLEKVPAAINATLEAAGLKIEDVSKFLIHQANGKMIKQMIQKAFKAKGFKGYDEKVLPLNVQFIGNNSVATIPVLWDWIRKGKLEGHEINKGDIVVIASVGAGMHANCIVYKA